jgi:hypothetical protein
MEIQVTLPKKTFNNFTLEAAGPIQYFVQCLQSGQYISTLDAEFEIAQSLLNGLNQTTTEYAGKKST